MQRVKQWLAGLVLVLGTLSWASPAQDLFDQASFYLEFYYFGPSTLDLKALTVKYQANLNSACAQERETCPYDKAVPVIQQMIRELGDGHTYYQGPESLAALRQQRTGNAPSRTLRIGIAYQPVEGSRDQLITDVVEGGPADQAGLLYGDRLIALNDRPFSELASPEEVQRTLTAAVQSGQPFKLTLLRGPKRERLEVTVVGREINLARMPSLKLRPDGIAVLKIPDFLASNRVGIRVHELVRQAQQAGAKGLILELRNNGGGSALDALVAMAAFVPDPYILFTDRYNQDRTVMRFRDGQATVSDDKGTVLFSLPVPNLASWKGPVAILVNSRSASASEYLTSALRLGRVGVVIGETTAGVGNTTTRTYRLINGGGLNLSENRAFLANGDSYPDVVRPDITVPDDLKVLAEQGRDLPFERALEALGVKQP
ncbi:S41 family peptidase [Calidithermus chliarophilus]|uniref:S41 family peptidase n=1 Tax=Calidithermus chliarophilus TaxID=52023 RepID=UPI000487B42B|nr:S41 family peptidase [Calidithermus chliarophilus]